MSTPRKHLPRLLAAGLSAPVLAWMFTAAPAFADSPTVVDQHVVRHLFAGTCNGQPVVADFDFDRTLTIFHDADGAPLRQVIHAQLNGTVHDTVTGVSLPLFGVRTIFLTAGGQFERSTGTNVHIVVAGSGTVDLGAGNAGIDDDGNFYAHGRQDGPITEALCEALAR